MKDPKQTGPKAHAKNIYRALNRLSDNMQKDIDTTQDERAKALLETSAEILQGLARTFADFIAEKESAWEYK